jgi:hypothetical protein
MEHVKPNVLYPWQHNFFKYYDSLGPIYALKFTVSYNTSWQTSPAAGNQNHLCKKFFLKLSKALMNTEISEVDYTVV